jgi:allantoinase
MLNAARAPGVDVSVETCPHYLTFDAEHIADAPNESQVLPADPRGLPTGEAL